MLSSSQVLRDRRGGEYKARSEVLRRGYGVELPVPEDDDQVDMLVKAVRTTIGSYRIRTKTNEYFVDIT